MKPFKTIWLSIVLLSVASCSILNKSAADKRTLPEKVESKDFTVFFERCLPTGLEVTTFRSDEIFRLKNGIAYAFLPFHGLLNVNPIDMTDGPIRINGPVKDFSLTKNTVNGWSILFKVESNPYLYQVDIKISNKGKAVVTISSNKRSTMIYYGEVD